LRDKTNKNVAKKISATNFCYIPEDKDNNIIHTHSEITKFSDRPKININIDPNNFCDNTVNPVNHTNNNRFINLINVRFYQ